LPRTESIDIVPKRETRDFYRDYCKDFRKLEELYFGDPKDISKYLEMTEDPYLRLVKREPLVEALTEYNEQLGAPQKAMENIRALKLNGTYCVLCWQHPYLLGGPFETFLKVVTTIKLCERLSKASKDTFVPVLWIESPFDDLTEVNRVYLGKGATLIEERLEVDETPRPAIDVEIGAAYDGLLERLRKHLPETDHSEWLFDTLRESKGFNLGEHAGRVMSRLFGKHGLVVAAPHVLFERTAELIARAIENPDGTADALRDARITLESLGYPCEFIWDDPLSLYYLRGKTRTRLTYRDGRYWNDSTGKSLSPKNLARRLNENPQRFVTGVMLSPIAQDFAIPSVAKIAGPGGCQFLGLQKKLYDTLYVAYPQVTPQISATFVDGWTEKGLKEMRETVETLLNEAERKGPQGEDRAVLLRQMRQTLGEAVDAYRDARETKLDELAEAAKLARDSIRKIAEDVQSRAEVGDEHGGVYEAFDAYADDVSSIAESASEPLAVRRRDLQDVVTEKVGLDALQDAADELVRLSDTLVKAARYKEPKGLTDLGKSLERSLTKIGRDAMDEAERKARLMAADEHTVRTMLAPKGGLQEDTIAMVQIMNDQGPELLEKALAHLDDFDFDHQVLYLDG
jgi:bacillithiol biosynthesis cysteine-adding enzyme BshC